MYVGVAQKCEVDGKREPFTKVSRKKRCVHISSPTGPSFQASIVRARFPMLAHDPWPCFCGDTHCPRRRFQGFSNSTSIEPIRSGQGRPPSACRAQRGPQSRCRSPTAKPTTDFTESLGLCDGAVLGVMVTWSVGDDNLRARCSW